MFGNSNSLIRSPSVVLYLIVLHLENLEKKNQKQKRFLFLYVLILSHGRLVILLFI